MAIVAVVAACGDEHPAAAPPSDGGSEAHVTFDLCDVDAFRGSGAPCPVVSPVACFPMCDAGGCFCRATAEGPRWDCVVDLSCYAACGPLVDACAADGGPEAEGTGDAGLEAAARDGQSG